MLVEAISAVIYGVMFISLILVDYALGHGFVDMFQKIFCKVACFIKKTVREEAKQVVVIPENPINFPVLFMEILVLSLTIAFLNKYKQLRSKDRIDDLLHESKEALRQTNEFLEKWRLRREARVLRGATANPRELSLFLNEQQVPTEYSYLDEEPQEIKPLKFEVPILHMAIIDTLGTSRSQPERGDAGDTVNITDSTLLSITSLLDDELESLSDPAIVEENIPEEPRETREQREPKDIREPKETRHVEFRNRTLWDVMEEDVNTLED